MWIVSERTSRATPYLLNPFLIRNPSAELITIWLENESEVGLRRRARVERWIIGGIYKQPGRENDTAEKVFQGIYHWRNSKYTLETRKFLKSGIAQDTDSSASGIHARGWKSFRGYFREFH